MTRDLKALHSTQRGMTSKKLEDFVNSFTIIEKIEFSNISKDRIRTKIEQLRTKQVPNRTVLLNVSDTEVTEYWFKNWLHTNLKHWVIPSSPDKKGCSQETIFKDIHRDTLRAYENGQQNYKYGLADIEHYINQGETT